jgi:hypothetical protein
LDGRDGIPGEPGLDGIPGRNGLDGLSGKNGIDGFNGIAGSPGYNGTDGEFIPILRVYKFLNKYGMNRLNNVTLK